MYRVLDRERSEKKCWRDITPLFDPFQDRRVCVWGSRNHRIEERKETSCSRGSPRSKSSLKKNIAEGRTFLGLRGVGTSCRKVVSRVGFRKVFAPEDGTQGREFARE